MLTRRSRQGWELEAGVLSRLEQRVAAGKPVKIVRKVCSTP